MKKSQEKLKLDQIMRVLFKLSKKVIINLMNGLFEENFKIDEVSLDYSNGEFIIEDYERITGDMYISIQNKLQVYRYHIEFQTLNDLTMAIRMFRYGFEKAMEVQEKEAQEEIKLEFPKQLVIFLEENENIKDELSFILKLPDGNDIKYTVPVMKYWKYTPKELENKKMYALLPLQVFKSRKIINTIYNSKLNKAEKGKLINEEFRKLTDTIGATIKIIGELHESEELYTRDLEKILRVITNITEYLYNKYGEYNKVSVEVGNMVTTLFNPAMKRQAKMEGKMEGKIEDILDLLEEHGIVSKNIREKVEKETNPVKLRKWLKLAAKVDSIDEFSAQMDI